MKKNSGIATVMYIVIVAVILSSLVTVGYSRYLLAIERNKSNADSIVGDYHTEGIMNDVVYRILNGKIDEPNFEYTQNLSDGSSVKVVGDINAVTQEIEVTTTRAFSVSKLRATGGDQIGSSSIQDTEVIFMMDCSGSMDLAANGQLLVLRPTRFEKLRESVGNFINKISEQPFSNQVKFGLGVFQTNAGWLRTESGIDVNPQNSLTHQQVYDALHYGIGVDRGDGTSEGRDQTQDSPACLSIGLGGTNIGGGIAFAQDYLRGRPNDVRKIIIVVTDGIPNARTPDTRCRTDVYETCEEGHADDTICKNESLEFLRCSITSDKDFWRLGRLGRLEEDIEVYAVTVLPYDTSNMRTIDLFREKLPLSNYYSLENALELPEIIGNQFFNDIISNIKGINIRKISP